VFSDSRFTKLQESVGASTKKILTKVFINLKVFGPQPTGSTRFIKGVSTYDVVEDEIFFVLQAKFAEIRGQVQPCSTWPCVGWRKKNGHSAHDQSASYAIYQILPTATEGHPSRYAHLSPETVEEDSSTTAAKEPWRDPAVWREPNSWQFFSEKNFVEGWPTMEMELNGKDDNKRPRTT
jgi:hypothetical protein